MENLRTAICTAAALIGSTIAQIFGGWNSAMTTLLICMVIDWVTGLMVALVFHNSKKSDTGAYESRAGWKGLCRKGVTLLLVLIAARLDLLMGVTFCKDCMVIGFCVNEIVSILENAGLMGVKYPPFINKALDALTKKYNVPEEWDETMLEDTKHDEDEH